jgi:hypothetical protein
VLEFFAIFLGSVTVGTLVGFGTALIIRTKWIPEQNGSLYEVGLVVSECESGVIVGVIHGEYEIGVMVSKCEQHVKGGQGQC